MLWVPQKGIVRREHNIGTTGTDILGTSVVSGAAASTKGAWAELIAATAFDAYWVIVASSGWGAAGVDSATALDIGIGAATEEVLIPDLLPGYAGNWGQASSAIGACMWQFPLYIPAGSRLSARAASERTSTAGRVQIWLLGGDGCPPFRVGSKITTYGMAAVPIGTAIAPGASGSQGSWLQIVDATIEDHFAFMPSFQPEGDVSINGRRLMVGIGIGAATEKFLGDWACATDGNEMMSGLFPNFPVFHDVPSGTRLVMRASNNGTNDGGYGGVIHAVS